MFKRPVEIIQELLDMGYTITEIARRAGIPQPTVYAMYNDPKRRPSYDRVARVAQVLDSVRGEQRIRQKRAAASLASQKRGHV